MEETFFVLFEHNVLTRATHFIYYQTFCRIVRSDGFASLNCRWSVTGDVFERQRRTTEKDEDEVKNNFARHADGREKRIERTVRYYYTVPVSTPTASSLALVVPRRVARRVRSRRVSINACGVCYDDGTRLTWPTKTLKKKEKTKKRNAAVAPRFSPANADRFTE